MKHLKIGINELAAFGFILFAAAQRLLAVGLGWPLTNSDEDTMGIMARHILFKGERPVFFYGQNYMGATEAYVAAALFHMFGPNLFAFRLGLVLMFAVFLLGVYLLTRLIYTKNLALFVVALLSLGSSPQVAQQLIGLGGYSETLMFGSFSFLIAAWLGLTYRKGLSARQELLRFGLYGLWGLVAGLGLYSDLLIIPFVAMSGLIILVTCWREMLTPAPLFLVLGLFIGSFPLIAYNLKALPGQDSLSVLKVLRQANGGEIHPVRDQVLGTIQLSIPTATGSPFCTGSELAIFAPPVPRTPACLIVQTSWGVGYLLLLVISTLLTVWGLWKLVRLSRPAETQLDKRQEYVRYVSRFLLLMSAAITLLSYVTSPASAYWPEIHSRYIIGLLIVTPAALWPLWRGATIIGRSGTETMTRVKGGFISVKAYACRFMLVLIGLAYLGGTIVTFAVSVPIDQAQNQQQDQLIANLLRIGATHIYTDYWTCNRLAFISEEKIVCGILDDNLRPRPNSMNRYYPYYLAVKADPRAAYVYQVDNSDASIIYRRAHVLNNPNVQHYVFNGYDVYQPRSP